MDYGQNPMQQNSNPVAPGAGAVGFDPNLNNPWHTPDNPVEGQLTVNATPNTVPTSAPALGALALDNNAMPTETVNTVQSAPMEMPNVAQEPVFAPVPEQAFPPAQEQVFQPAPEQMNAPVVAPAEAPKQTVEAPAFQIEEVDPARSAMLEQAKGLANKTAETKIKIGDNLQGQSVVDREIGKFRSGQISPAQFENAIKAWRGELSQGGEVKVGEQ